MSTSAHVYPNVVFGANARLGDFVVIGEPPLGRSAGELVTQIGANAVIRSHTVIYAGNVIGDRLRTGHGVLIREANRIGSNVSIGSHTVIEHDVVISDDVWIHSKAFIPEYSVLEAGCFIGPGVIFTNARYPRTPDTKRQLRGPVVRVGAKIGAGAILLPGVVIGEEALVGAGAVVVKDVPERTIVVGNPARVVRKVADVRYARPVVKGRVRQKGAK